MSNFAYIPIIALLCYTFLLLAFMAARKNHIVNAFLTVLIALILWTGGSFCMRMQLWPSLKFWYDASILGLTLLPYSFLYFVSEFADLKNKTANKIWLITILIANIINICTGFFLKAPDVTTDVDRVNIHAIISILSFLPMDGKLLFINFSSGLIRLKNTAKVIPAEIV